MLNINKNDVDFLVTANMVDEVKNVINRDFPKIDAICKEMLKRGVDKVYFVACGSPLCACQTAKHIFEKYSNIPCEAYSGWDFLDNTPYKLDNKCLVIGVSQSGKTEEVSDSIKLARERGALTVGVTRDPEGTPLTKASERVIAYAAECIWEVHLLITYRFALELIKGISPSAEIDKIEEDILRLPEILAELVVSSEEKSKELGLRASKWPLVYTVASGLLNPLAYKEGVITMMEFTWTHGASLNASEFRHGPLEIVNKDVPFVILMGTDESRHTIERTYNFVKRYSDEYIVFDYEEISHGLHPMLAPMVLFVPLEYFYYYLSIGKDHNPDDRRYYGGIVKY